MEKELGTELFLGVDACKGGWAVATVKTDGRFLSFSIEKSFEKVLAVVESKSAPLSLIDIPIGLKSKGSDERKCDLKAREFLGNKRRSSVFRVPLRQAVYADNREEASTINNKYTGKKVGVQTWGIVPKIVEVDRLLSQNPDIQSRVKETHPEVCFCGLNVGISLLYKKRRKNGINERLRILKRFSKNAETTYNDALQRYPRHQLARDDVLDAMAAAITALQCWLKRPSIFPSAFETEKDERGLRMEMVYWRSVAD